MPSAAIPRDVRQGGVAHAFWPHKLGFQTGGARLAQHLAHFRVVTAVVNEVDILFLQTGDQRGEVFLTGGNAVEEDDVCAAFFQAVLNGARQAFAVLLLVMNDGNTLWLNRVSRMYFAAVGPCEESRPAVRIMCW